MALERVLRNERGQSLTEYLLMLFVAMASFLLLTRGLKDMDFFVKLTRPLSQEFAASYRYGHPKAKGFEEGQPEYHPRIFGGKNFRLFINPSK